MQRPFRDQVQKSGLHLIKDENAHMIGVIVNTGQKSTRDGFMQAMTDIYIYDLLLESVIICQLERRGLRLR